MTSIIVPVYNVEKYITDCLDSIINQSDDNFEVLIVDDNSVDKSGEICDEYAKKDSRIKVIHNQTNLGVSASRNIALSKVKGDFILFVDSDDCIHHKLLEICTRIIKISNADVVIFPYKNFIESNEITNAQYQNVCYKELILDQDQFLSEFFGCVNIQHFRGIVWNKLYKANLFKNVTFPEKRAYGEDSKVTYEISKEIKKSIWLENAYLYFYRDRESSAMNKPFSVKNLEIMDTYNEIYLDVKNFNYKYRNKSIYAWTVRFFDLINLIKSTCSDNKKSLFNVKCHFKLLEILTNRYITKKQKVIIILFKYNKKYFINLF